MVDLTGPSPVRGVSAAARPHAGASPRPLRPGGDDLAGKSLPQLVSMANELASQPPPIDHARIADIRAAISAGGYAADPERIAEALLGGAE